MPPKKQKPAYVPSESEHSFPTAAELGVKNQASKKQESCPIGCLGFDPKISTLKLTKTTAVNDLIALPCKTTTLKGVCKRAECRAFIEDYLTVEEWNAHLAHYTAKTGINPNMINEHAHTLRITMAKKHYAKYNKTLLKSQVSQCLF